ncbi:MAG: SMP-30/gluconolactonase/LRE family protein [Chloroflexia bacterium]|nr:SMP-30/gluconolactonase/LRE family protein [Chloroflexia bacterium]
MMARVALTTFTLPPGDVYPGTPHVYQVYVPTTNDHAQPAPFMIFLDGPWIFVDRMQTPAILDRLIAAGDLPPLIGIFVDPGVLPVLSEATQQPRINRHVEYDSITDRFARFLLDELIPAVGQDYPLSADPNDRGLAGISSGAVAAFVAARERPDQFRRVLSCIGTFVDMRGANVVPSWIRKTEPKTLRVFLQETVDDHDIVYGSWPLGNQSMAATLAFAQYDHTLIVGPGGHDLEHATSILPDALRWLWRDYPASIAAATSGPIFAHLLYPDQPWQQVGGSYASAVHPAANKAGDVFFADPVHNRISMTTADGSVAVFTESAGGVSAVTFGPDDRLYAVQPARRRIVSYGAAGDEATVAVDIDAYDLVVTAAGVIYATDPVRRAIVAIDAEGRQRTVYDGGEIAAPTALALSPDQAFLTVLDAQHTIGWSFPLARDGSLGNGQPFFRMEWSDQGNLGGVEGMAVDTLGELYIPTALGITVSTQSGRSREIIASPEPGPEPVSAVAFGGPARDWLYATQNGTLFRRRIKRQGAVPWEPVKPPMPQL